MHNVRARPCQTSWLGVVLWGVIVLSVLTPARANGASPAPDPPPPPWQNDLTAARAMQVSFALAPAKNAAEEKARAMRLADVYRELAKKYPTSSSLQLAVGDGLAELDSPEAGVSYWQSAASLDPQNAEAADALGSAYLRVNHVRAAFEQFQRAVEARPDVARYHTALANVLFLFRHELHSLPALPDDQAVLRLALEHFRRAAELSPGDLPLAKAYAETFYAFAQPDWAQALAAWQAVLTLSGSDTDFANSHLARISVRMGRKEAAEAYLASIRTPAFNGLKANLTKQLARKGAAATSAKP